mmetsp:Transcript_82831/g.200922  ORF Transcript_82831/g.200922 Transcript_82831/m.200922 type:complete len:84 (-) Transcript_82831:176-427(-)
MQPLHHTTSICGSGDVDEKSAGDVGGGERGVLRTQRISMVQEAYIVCRAELLCWCWRERGVAFVSIGHRASLEEYHDEVMELS